MSLAFLLTSFLVVVSPGTGVVYTIAAGLARGRRASVVAAFGCTLGIVPHLAAAIVGLAALLYASSVAYQTIKLVGVAYLLVLAWRTWRDRSAFEVQEHTAPTSDLRVIGSAVAVNLLNPKLSLFFFAFLPQFVRPGEPHRFTRMLELGGTFMLLTLAVFVAYGVAAAAVRRQLVSRPRALLWLRRTFAGGFVALGVRLAASSR